MTCPMSWSNTGRPAPNATVPPSRPVSVMVLDTWRSRWGRGAVDRLGFRQSRLLGVGDTDRAGLDPSSRQQRGRLPVAARHVAAATQGEGDGGRPLCLLRRDHVGPTAGHADPSFIQRRQARAVALVDQSLFAAGRDREGRPPGKMTPAAE